MFTSWAKAVAQETLRAAAMANLRMLDLLLIGWLIVNPWHSWKSRLPLQPARSRSLTRPAGVRYPKTAARRDDTVTYGSATCPSAPKGRSMRLEGKPKDEG